MTAPDKNTQDLCMRMGLALSVWDQVETQHYYLFLALLSVEESDVPSVVYFSTTDFDARRTMVDRMVQCFPTTKGLRKEWEDINKLLKDGSLNRNKIAHYGLYFDIYERTADDGKSEYRVTGPNLQPSAYNKVAKLLGRSGSKPEHNLSAREVDRYIIEFGQLAMRVSRFGVDCWRLKAPTGSIRKPPPPILEVSPRLH